MKEKILNISLIVTSLFGYLEWSGNSHSFLFEAERELLLKLFSDPVSAINTFTVLPLIGQIMLVFTLFQKKPSRFLTYAGMLGLGILLGFMFVIGVFSVNYKILLSTVPFIIMSVVTVQYYRKHIDHKHHHKIL